MGMTNTQINLIRAIAENKTSDIKNFAILCCKEDKTQKNKYYVSKYQNILEQKTSMIKMPYNIEGMAQMEDVSASFREDRYYLSGREGELFQKITKMNAAGLQLMEMGIPYLNAILLTGVSGTGKTTFGRYVAHKLELPFLYINFSYLIDSYLGNTSKNLRNIFDFARMNKCLLMLDEIDCIAQSRKGSSEGATREFNNTTITLLQELDKIQNDSIIIGTTNIPESIDPAVKRRFPIKHEISAPTKDECIDIVNKYLASIDMNYNCNEIEKLADNFYNCELPDYKQPTQATIVNYIIEKIANAIINNQETITLI